MSNKEKYLVTGAAGFIGANVTRALTEQGRVVYPLVGPETNRRRLNDLKIDSENYITVDVTDYSSLRQEVLRVRPSHILHLATYGVYRDQSDQFSIFNTNVLGTANLLRIGLDLDLAAFINTGSVFEYGNLPGEQDEESVGKPRNMYDLAKIIGTQTATNFANKFGLPVCTLRLFTAYGPYEDKRRLVPSVILGLMRRQMPNILTPQSVRDFIHIQDIVDAYCLAAAKQNWHGEVINIGSGQPMTVADVIDQVARLLGLEKPSLETDQAAPLEDSRSWANTSVAKDLLNWRPRMDLFTGLEQTIGWFKQHQDLYEE